MKTCVAACLRGAAVGVCVLFSAAGAAFAQQGETDPNSQATDATAAEPAEGTALPKVVVTSPKEKKKAATKKVAGKGTGSGTGEGGATGEAATQDAGGVSGAANSDVKVDGVLLGGPAVSDTGTTQYDSRNVRIRTDGSGDVNTFLRNLPNVQYQNDTSNDAGAKYHSTIDTRPALLSINGARNYENNFILNGVSISNITGSAEPFEADDIINNENDGTPNLNAMYGLHPQTVFVPTEFIGTATLIDSNASAEYGQFQGGVVIYDLAQPPTDRYHTSVSYDRHTDDMVHYRLATPTKTNPLNRKAPTFEKENLAASVGAPITSDLSFILQASRRTADTSKQKNYTYFDSWAVDDSENTFLRFATALKTSIGRFTFDTSFTDYSQVWQSPSWRDLEMDVTTKSSTSQIEYFGALPAIAAPTIGLDGVTLKSRVYYNNSDTGNYTNSDEAWTWIAARRRKVGDVWTEPFRTDQFDDWCRSDPIESLTGTQNNTTCSEGGYGNKEQGQTDLGINAQLKGNVFLGNFLIGGEAKSVEGRRARLADFKYYTSFVTATGNTSPNSPAGGVFHCLPGDDLCWSNMYNRIYTVSPAFDIEETVNALHGYAELDQTYGWFNVRAGVRVDYEDYFKNINVAPRLVGNITPLRGLTFSGGYNRYYLGETLYYALRDSQPFTVTYTRPNNGAAGNGHDADGNVFPFPDTPTNAGRMYTFRSADLDTPYTDEYTGGVRIKETIFGGHVRLRYLERYSEDRFSSKPCPGTNCSELNNDAHGFYRSATAEYTKYWYDINTPFFLNAAAITANVTWSEQTMSRNTYFDNLEDLDGATGLDNPILYKGASYTRDSFQTVTGNLDIPVRIGATLSTNWFNNFLLVDVSVGYNLGYEGVYDTGTNQPFGDAGRIHDVWDDRTFDPALLVDVAGQVNVTENAAIEFQVNNLLDSTGNKVATNNNPWVLGRSYWVGSVVRF